MQYPLNSYQESDWLIDWSNWSIKCKLFNLGSDDTKEGGQSLLTSDFFNSPPPIHSAPSITTRNIMVPTLILSECFLHFPLLISLFTDDSQGAWNSHLPDRIVQDGIKLHHYWLLFVGLCHWKLGWYARYSNPQNKDTILLNTWLQGLTSVCVCGGTVKDSELPDCQFKPGLCQHVCVIFGQDTQSQLLWCLCVSGRCWL